MVNVNFNKEKNGIEVSFDSIPDASVLANLKEHGFRWSRKQRFWYAKNNEQTVSVANVLLQEDGQARGEVSICQEKVTPKKNDVEYNLWVMTRTDDIEDNFSKYRIYDNKEIASIIRKHLKERFPMCKWSVRSDRHSIHVNIKSSPFEKNSDELNAIVHYAYKFAQSYNYDNSDSMTDYFDVNFYGVYESSIVEYDYEKRDMTVDEHNMCLSFQEKKAAYEKAEQLRQEEEYKRRMEEEEENREISKAVQLVHDKNNEIIDQNAEIKEVDYFVLNVSEPDINKLSCISEYEKEDVKYHSTNCRVTREVYLTPDVYDMFSRQLLSEHLFFCEKGGYATDDKRIGSYVDFRNMNEKERETVEWYHNDCVAIFCGGSMKLIVDPQGYGYARYVFFVTEKSSLYVKDYKTKSGIDEDAYLENRKAAVAIEKASEEVIQESSMEDTWYREDLNKYKDLMLDYIERYKLPFSTSVIRAVKDDILKTALYMVLIDYNDAMEQLVRSGIKAGEPITIIRLSDIGGVITVNGKFDLYMRTNFAQYKNIVKLLYTPKGERKMRGIYLNNPTLIYRGWIDLPKELFWETRQEENGITISQTKYLSFDREQFDVAMEYLSGKGMEPVVNTYNP